MPWCRPIDPAVKAKILDQIRVCFDVVTLHQSLYKIIVAEIVRWNSIIEGLQLGGYSLQ